MLFIPTFFFPRYYGAGLFVGSGSSSRLRQIRKTYLEKIFFQPSINRFLRSWGDGVTLACNCDNSKTTKVGNVLLFVKKCVDLECSGAGAGFLYGLRQKKTGQGSLIFYYSLFRIKCLALVLLGGGGGGILNNKEYCDCDSFILGW